MKSILYVHEYTAHYWSTSTYWVLELSKPSWLRGDGCVEDEHIDSSKLPHSCVDDSFAVFLLGHVCSHSEHVCCELEALLLRC